MSATPLRTRRSRTGWHTVVVRPPKSTQADINITPLIDVVLVLLIIFMVMTPLLEKNLSVLLPREERTAKATEIPPRQVLVFVGPAGELRVNEQPVAAGDYVAQLRARLAGLGPDQQSVFVFASDATRVPSVVAAMDGAKQAGASAVGLGLGTEAAP